MTPMVIQGMTLPIHIALCYILTQFHEWGVFGVGMATNITFFLNFSVVALAIYFNKDINKYIAPVDRKTFRRLWGYIKIGIPTTIMVCFDLWSFAILTLISHFLGINENAG
jgi:MATE family multidrug resistance protein